MPPVVQSVTQFDAAAYWNRRLTDDPSLTGVGTRPFGATYQRYLYKLKEHAIKRVLRQHRINLSGADVLNVGCGIGYFEPFFAQMNAKRIVGIDVARSSIERLRETQPQFEYATVDISRPLATPLSEQRFDCVTAIDVLYHIIDDHRFALAMENVCRLCCKNGVILFTESPLASTTDQSQHVRHRDPQSIDKTLSQYGFRVAHRTPMYHFFDRQSKWAYRLARYPNVSFPLLYAADRLLAERGWRRDANYCALAVRKN